MNPPKPQMDRMISAPDSNEVVNALSHLLGALLAIAATAVLVILAAREQKWVHLVGFAVYGTSLVLAMLASGLLHGVLAYGRYSRVLGILDHCAIYLLIAGSYTPLCLTLFAPPINWLLCGLVWSLATVGIVLKAVFFVRMSSLVSNLSYIGLGWLAIVFMAPIYRNLGGGAIAVIVVAGLLYTLGAISFQRGRPNPFPPYFGNHELWHVAVLLGNGLLFYVMLVYVLPYP